jgi:hypothetical protein
MKLKARKRQGPASITEEEKNEKTMKQKEASAAALAAISRRARIDHDFNEIF